MARNQRGQLPVMPRKQERQTITRIPGDRATNVGGGFRFALLVPRSEAGRSVALASESRAFGSGAWSEPRMILRLAHVTYRSLVADPVGTIARIYDAFDLNLSKDAREAMAAKVAQAPNGGYGANRYRPEEFGIDPERERASVYVERFGIAS
jgi:hypothetical protein